MRNDNDKKTSLILSACGVVPVVWLALLTAPYVGGGIVEIIRGLTDAMGSPFAITVCEDSVKTVLIFLLAYAMGIGVAPFCRAVFLTPAVVPACGEINTDSHTVCG